MDSIGFSDDESSGHGRDSDEVRSSGSTRDDELVSGAVEQFANLPDSKEEAPGEFRNCLPRGKNLRAAPAAAAAGIEMITLAKEVYSSSRLASS